VVRGPDGRKRDGGRIVRFDRMADHGPAATAAAMTGWDRRRRSIMNAVQLSVENLERFGEYTTVYYEDQSFTNAQLAERAQKLATLLDARRIEAGDRVLVMMPNNPEVYAAFQAIWRIGAVILPITPQLGPTEVNYLLSNSEAKAAITTPLLAPVLAQAAQGVATLRHLLVFGASEAEGAEDISSAIEAADPYPRIVDREGEDLAVLLYTSGTTGKPKGVMLSHDNVLSNARDVFKLAPEIEPFRVGLAVLPLSHSFGILMMNLGSIYGSVGVVLPQFDLQQVFEAIERHKVYGVALVPTMMAYMLNFPDRDKFDTSSLAEVVSGGAALPDEVRLEMERVFDCRLKDGYGMSECTTSVCGYRDEEPHRPGSVGRPIPGTELKIVDPEDNPLPPGEDGEICIKGPGVMMGYWRNEEATREALRGGWMHSGDLGQLDEDGYLFITGRVKDLIIKGAENISPNELEDAIHKHPGVADVAVIGVPDTVYGENIWALVVPAVGHSPTEDEIKEHAGQYVTKFKIPARVLFRDALPMTHSGKVRKTELRKEAAALLEQEG
jgi:long-chain acyl-CoA synthetase